ncbi:MAG: 4-hydroxy-3-methylbut-2-enyl diphosphate reductase [Alistipes sp.]|nr:4-hydroxy-3-methylbut-2-enyl diphosphate reductase [Alistipes sp.]
MLVEIDKNSGFCFGVVRAITKAEAALKELGGEVCSLGDIVHNRVEVQRLERMGLRTVTHSDMPELQGRHLFIRAHGEPPSTYRMAEEYGINVIDATCPVVAQLQRKVVEAHKAMREVGGSVVILGKRGHAEVVGLTGQVAEPTIVVESEADLDQVDFSRPVFFLSQTTQSIGLFHRLVYVMRERLSSGATLTVDDTICRRVSNREMALVEFAQRFDVVIFVSGRKSSNGKVLFEVCRGANVRSYQVEDESELCDEWFGECASVGICGATSTPAWLMEQVAEAIRARY